MKVLSVKQPWASLLVNGYKEFEFRSWKTKFRGKVLIHASKSVDTRVMDRFKTLDLDYPTGAIIGVVEVVDCVEVDKDFEDKLILENELVYGASRGRDGYAFQIANPKKFDEVIKAKGSLGFWNYDLLI